MKKHLLFLSALFFLVGCEGANTFEPSEGGSYDQTTDKADLIDKLPRIESLGAVTVQSEIKVGEKLTAEDVTVVANWLNAEQATTNIHPDEVELDTSVAGDQTGVVIVHCTVENYEYTLSATFNIKVVEEEAETPKVPVSIKDGSVSFSKEYGVGDKVTLDDVTLTVVYDDGSEEILHPTSIELDTSLAGTVNARITYGELEKTVQITISGEAHEKTLVSLELITEMPTEIGKGGVLPYSDIELKAIYSDGSSETVKATNLVLDTSVGGTATGRVYYNNLSVGFDIEVIDSDVPVVSITGIEVTNAPTAVNIGDSIDTDDVDITIKYSNNAVDLAKPTSIEFSSAVAGSVTATVHYNDFSASFVVTVIDPNEEEEEEEVLQCTYRIYFSYSHTTKYNPDTKKDVDCPLLEFTAPMLYPLGEVPSDIAVDGHPDQIDVQKVKDLGTANGFVVDPAFPNFLGFSKYGICLTTDQLWDFATDYQQQAVVSLYGVWVD